MPSDKFKGSVDKILEDVKQEQPTDAADRVVDQILNELGLLGEDGIVTDLRREQEAARPAAKRQLRRDKAAQPVQKTTDAEEATIELELPMDAKEQNHPAPWQDDSPTLNVTELVDEEFTEFFSKTVAVMPEDLEAQDQPVSFFEKLIAKCKGLRRPLSGGEKTMVVPDLTEAAQAAETAEPEVSSEQEFDTKEIDLGGAAAEFATREIRLDGQEPKEKKNLLHFDWRGWLKKFTREEEPGEPFAEPEEDAIEDYEALEDAPAVQANLAGNRLGWELRAVLTGILAVVLLYLGFSATGMLPPIASISPDQSPAAFLGVNLLLLLACMGLCWDVMRDGVLGVEGHATAQTMPVLGALGAGLQLLILLIGSGSYAPDKITLFAGPAALLLCLTLLGKALMGRVMQRNFEQISQSTDYAAGYQLRNVGLTEKICSGMDEPDPRLLLSRPTALVKGFLRQSFSHAPSEKLAQKLSWALLASSVVGGIIAVIESRDLFTGVSAITGTLVLGSPLCSTLLAAVPCMMMQKSAAQVGAVIPGWSAVEELGKTNMVMVEEKDLFPANSVLLHGIKTFERERIDLAILYAASILIEGCPTLRPVFMNIIQDKTEILYPLENLTCDPGCGFTAWIEHNRVIIGNRQMMQQHEVELPSLDYENRYTKGVRQPIYLAVSGKLFGMFVVSYHPDASVAKVLNDLRSSGISLLVRSDDFSLTDALVCSVYQLPVGSIKVLSAQDRKDLTPVTSYLPQSEGCITHRGTFASLIGGLRAAAGAAGSERTASLVQAVGVGFSCAMALLLAFTGGMASLALPAVLLYQGCWGALSLALPLCKKY